MIALADADAVTPEKPKDAMASISGQLGGSRWAGLSTGEHATLRRMMLPGKEVAAEGAVMKLITAAGLGRLENNQDYEAWKLVIHVAALLAGTARLRSHDLRRGVGMALQEAGYSENRLMRLTSARGTALRGQIVRAGRMMAVAGAGPVNLWTLFHLAGRDQDKAEEARIRIAQDYYAAAARQAGG